MLYLWTCLNPFTTNICYAQNKEAQNADTALYIVENTNGILTVSPIGKFTIVEGSSVVK